MNIDLNTGNELFSKEIIEKKTFAGELQHMSEVQHQKLRHLLKENDSLYLKCRGKRERVKDQEFEIRELKEERDLLREDLHIMREEATRLEEERDLLREDLQKMREEATRLKEEGDFLREEATRLEEERDFLREDLQIMREEATRLEEERDFLRED